MQVLAKKLFRHVDWRGLLLLAVLLGFWEFAVCTLARGSTVAPSLQSIAGSFLELYRSGGLAQNYFSSLARVFAGFGIGALAGVSLGAVLALSTWAEVLLGPMITAMRQIPMFGIIPLFILWFGIGEGAKISFVALAAFHPALLNTVEGLRKVPASYHEVATVYMLSRAQLLRRVLVPCALPSILTGLKQGLAFAWIAVIGAELFVTSGSGVGNILEAGRSQFRMDIVLVAIVLIGGTGYLMNYAVGVLEAHMLRWRRTFS
jgi:sulfonate transport system permease protein